MLTILDGKLVRDALKKKLIADIMYLQQRSYTPCLAIIQIGDRSDSASYIRAKQKFAAEIGAKEMHIHLPEQVTQKAVLEKIEQLNLDSTVHGIIVQLPLPVHLDRDIVISTINPHKDVDGLTPASVKQWSEGKDGAMFPATARGIRELLGFYRISIAGKKVVVVGRSALVGKPVAAMCSAAGAIVTVCHSKTNDLAEATRTADIIVIAVGKPRLIGNEHVREGQVVIDVGTTADSVTGKLVGDTDFEGVSAVLGDTGAITPVPGGVGPLTVLALFENLYDACYNQSNLAKVAKNIKIKT